MTHEPSSFTYTGLLDKSRNQKVAALEKALLQQPQLDLQTTHVLAGKVYARTIFIPAGGVLTGAEHKRDHVNVVFGDISVTTDDGVKRLTGHHVIPTKAGMKRAGVAHADTWWTTICHTQETELDAIEDDLVHDAHMLQTRNPEIGCAQLLKLEN